MDRIGPKSLDVAGMIEHLGKAIAPRAGGTGSQAASTAAVPDLRTELAGLFNGVDTDDVDALRRARRAALPLIVREAFGDRASDGEVAHVVESLDALFEADERLTALLVRAVVSSRR